MRREDWTRQLANYLEGVRESKFVWGSFDCCLFVCSAIEAMTGVDPGKSLRGQYSTEDGAIELMLKEYGTCSLETLVESICKEMGYPETPPLSAQRGDVVLVNAPIPSSSFRTCLGIIAPGGRAAVASPRGFTLFPMRRFLRAWTVV